MKTQIENTPTGWKLKNFLDGKFRNLFIINRRENETWDSTWMRVKLITSQYQNVN